MTDTKKLYNVKTLLYASDRLNVGIRPINKLQKMYSGIMFTEFRYHFISKFGSIIPFNPTDNYPITYWLAPFVVKAALAGKYSSYPLHLIEKMIIYELDNFGWDSVDQYTFIDIQNIHRLILFM